MYLFSKVDLVFQQAFNNAYESNLPILIVRNNQLIQVQKGHEDKFIKEIESDIHIEKLNYKIGE